MDFDYCEEYLTRVSNKTLLWQELRKAHSVGICRLIKNQSCKKISRRKTD